EQRTASGIELRREVDVLHAVERPRQALVTAPPAKQRDDALAVVPPLEREEQLALDPIRSNGGWREEHRKPVTAIEGPADLVVPLLSPLYPIAAVPDRNTVEPQHVGQARGEAPILVGVREEHFAGGGHAMTSPS